MKQLILSLALVFSAGTGAMAQGMGDFSFGLDLGISGYSPVNKSGFYGEFSKWPAPELGIFGRYDAPSSPLFAKLTLPYLSTGRWVMFELEAQTESGDSYQSFYHYQFTHLLRAEAGMDFNKFEVSLGYGLERLRFRFDPQNFLGLNQQPYLGYLRARASLYAGRVFYVFGQYDRQIHGRITEFEAVDKYGQRQANEVRVHGFGFGIGLHFFNNTIR